MEQQRDKELRAMMLKPREHEASVNYDKLRAMFVEIGSTDYVQDTGEPSGIKAMPSERDTYGVHALAGLATYYMEQNQKLVAELLDSRLRHQASRRIVKKYILANSALRKDESYLLAEQPQYECYCACGEQTCH